MQAEQHEADELRILIPVDSVRLEGELVIPAALKGVVLFAHGSGSSRHSPRNQFVARTLRESGLATLLFDLLTESEEQAEARTRHLRFNVPFLAERLLAAVERLSREEGLNGLKTGFFGSSTGAAAALAAGAELGDHIRAIVSRGGRPDLAGEDLPRVTAPTLLLVGELDTQVIHLNQQAFAQLRCEKALEIIPGATHLFEEPGTLEIVARRSARWFVQHLSPEKEIVS